MGPSRPAAVRAGHRQPERAAAASAPAPGRRGCLSNELARQKATPHTSLAAQNPAARPDCRAPRRRAGPDLLIARAAPAHAAFLPRVFATGPEKPKPCLHPQSVVDYNLLSTTVFFQD